MHSNQLSYAPWVAAIIADANLTDKDLLRRPMGDFSTKKALRAARTWWAVQSDASRITDSEFVLCNIDQSISIFSIFPPISR